MTNIGGLDFNNLEMAILSWVAARHPQDAVAAQITSAKFLSRDWTQHGYFVDLSIDRNLPRISVRFPIDGPIIESEDLESGADSMLWGKDGWLTQIEIAAFGDKFPENLAEFELIDREKKIFLVLTEAEADGSDSRYSKGNWHSILLYLAATDHPELDACSAILGRLGWKNVEIKKSGVANERTKIKEEDRAIYDRAVESGSAVVVYQTPNSNRRQYD